MGKHSASTLTRDTSADQPDQPEQAKKNSMVLPAILVIVGLLVMLYPVVSTALNNYGTSKAAKEFAKLEKSVPQEVKDEQWERAHSYNERQTTGPILDPWLNEVNDHNPEYAAYLDQLNATDVMARLIFPEIQADLPIYHGTSDEVLAKGLGHLYGSDLPVGGVGTHSIITGHTGLTNVTLFDNLRKAKEGDAFYIQVAGHKLKYEIDQIKVVLPHETDDLRPVEGQDYISLITCTPYGINTHRLLVRGHQVPMDPSESKIFDQTHGTGWQWWMYALLVAVLVLGTGFAWWLWRQRLDADEELDDDAENADVETADGDADSDGLADGSESASEDNNNTSWWENDNE